jgi:hypothetical protein
MPHLDPQKLIPALVRYSPDRNPPGEPKVPRRPALGGGPEGEWLTSGGAVQNQAIRYLEYVVDRRHNRNPAIHNYLLSLFAQASDEIELLKFLTAQADQPVVDLKYALRLCHERGMKQACVYIYAAMGLFTEAVELALTFDDLDLAKRHASQPPDEDTRKRLWQRIARHVVENATVARDRKSCAPPLRVRRRPPAA